MNSIWQRTKFSKVLSWIDLLAGGGGLILFLLSIPILLTSPNLPKPGVGAGILGMILGILLAVSGIALIELETERKKIAWAGVFLGGAVILTNGIGVVTGMRGQMTALNLVYDMILEFLQYVLLLWCGFKLKGIHKS